LFFVDPPQSAPKTYVQHRVAARAADLRRLLLQQNAHVYVCGATSMGREVKEAVCQVRADKMTVCVRRGLKNSGTSTGNLLHTNHFVLDQNKIRISNHVKMISIICRE
jgi:NAD(P)H-flavin reductase